MDIAHRRAGRPSRISRAQVVEAALVLVEEQGFEGLTMRALARSLGVDAMAVYRHVRDKEDLLGAICDAVIAELPPLDLDAPWEPQVRRLADTLRDRLAARPGLVPALAGGPVTPAAVGMTQQAIAMLARQGVPTDLAAAVFGAVFSYVMGFALVEAAMPPAPDAAGAANAEPQQEEPDLPHLAVAVDLLSGAGDFELGLDLIVTGVRGRLAETAEGA